MDTPDGQWHVMPFQDHGAAGRTLLSRWSGEDGWPVLLTTVIASVGNYGVNPAVNHGCL